MIPKAFGFRKPFLFIFLIGEIGCTTARYYSPALFKNDVAYLEKPASTDSSKSAFYVSGSYGNHVGGTFSDQVDFGELNFAAGHTGKYVNVAYSVYGFYGAISNHGGYTTENTDHTYDFKSKKFYGLGGRFSANLYKKLARIDLRYLGFEADVSREYGDYLVYRNLVYDKPNYYAALQSTLLTIGGTSEVLFRASTKNDVSFAFRLFIGSTLGDFSTLRGAYSDYYRNDIPARRRPFYSSIGATISYDSFSATIDTRTTAFLLPSTIHLRLGYRF